jgi:hypothetical protein
MDGTKMTQSINAHVIEKDNVLSFAEATLAVYSAAYTLFRKIADIANHIVKMIWLLFALGLITVSVPVLALLVSLTIILLIYSVSVYKFGRAKTLSYYQGLERKDLIEIHLRFKRLVKKLESLKKSDLLFNSPVLGPLMRKYYRDVCEVESVVRAKAYPNHNTPPKNVTVHKYDPESVWQSDQSDLIRLH